MADRALIHKLEAVIRAADAESIRARGAARPDDDARLIEDLLDGTAPGTADVLAFVVRTPAVYDAITQAINRDSLRAHVKGGAS